MDELLTIPITAYIFSTCQELSVIQINIQGPAKSPTTANSSSRTATHRPSILPGSSSVPSAHSRQLRLGPKGGQKITLSLPPRFRHFQRCLLDLLSGYLKRNLTVLWRRVEFFSCPDPQCRSDREGGGLAVTFVYAGAEVEFIAKFSVNIAFFGCRTHTDITVMVDWA